jgi:hypothetical protein
MNNPHELLAGIVARRALASMDDADATCRWAIEDHDRAYHAWFPMLQAEAGALLREMERKQIATDILEALDPGLIAEFAFELLFLRGCALVDKAMDYEIIRLVRFGLFNPSIKTLTRLFGNPIEVGEDAEELAWIDENHDCMLIRSDDGSVRLVELS